jgi:hypothetical protein
MQITTANTNRWYIGSNIENEVGSNVGTNLIIASGSDTTGGTIGTPVTIYRSNGAVSLGTSITSPYYYLPAKGAGVERQIMWNFTSRNVYFYGDDNTQTIGLYDTVYGNRFFSSNTGMFQVPSFSTSGTMTLPSGGGNNYIKAGTGDGASFTTYNLKINSWWGIGFGDYQDLTTVKAYLDTRNGHLGLSGALGVGTTASGTNGEIRATNNITAYYGSDRRLKTKIVNILDPITKLKKINGVTFDWTDEEIARRGGIDEYFVRKHDVGVIAQEIEEVLPEIVATRLDGFKAVQYEKIVPLLIEAIKELSDQVDDMRKQIEELKNK